MLRRSSVVIGVVSLLLFLSVSPVRGFSTPKLVISLGSGILVSVASDSAGSLYYLSTSSTEADLYRLAAGGSTPQLVFVERFPSAQNFYVSHISFDGNGSVYFLTQEFYPPDLSGSTEIDSHIYKLDASNSLAPAQLYSASANTCLNESCITLGEVVVSIGTNSRGDVAAGVFHYSASLNATEGLLIYIPARTGVATVRATFGANLLPDSQTALVVGKGGDAFLVLLSGSAAETIEVTRNGVVKPLAPGLPLGLGLDASGNLFVVSRSLVGRQCLGVATSSTFTIEKFNRTSLSQPSPSPTIVSQETYPGYVILAGDSTQVRVTSGGTIFYASYPSTMTSCSDPLSWSARILALPKGASHPVLTVTGTNPPASIDFFYLAVFGGNLYYGSQVSGAIYLVEHATAAAESEDSE